jgi:DNA-binding response OmpR family regulator
MHSLSYPKFDISIIEVGIYFGFDNSMTTHYLPHILLIDDDQDDRELFASALGVVSPRSSLSVSGDCMDALSRIDTGAFQIPDAIFLDLHLIKVSGFDCVVLIQQHRLLHAVPIIVMSSSEVQSETDRLFNMGVKYFIIKPLPLGNLRQL